LIGHVLDWSNKEWRRTKEQFEPFMRSLTSVLGRAERRVAATRYVEGLLVEGQRKSIEPMAFRLGVDPQSLQQFVADSPWSAEELWSRIRKEVIPSFEPIESWIIDETGWLKQGQRSVGVAHQYCGAAGKKANCQVSVELVVSDGTIGVPAGARLYLPEVWTKDAQRCREAGVPEEIEFKTKPQIALGLIDQAMNEGVLQAPVLADSVYGDGSEFRKGLRERGCEYFLQVSPAQHKAWTHEVSTHKKFKRRYVKEGEEPARTLLEIAQSLPAAEWKHCSWKARDGSTRHTRLAWVEIYLGHDLRNPHGELEKSWLVIDWPKAEEIYHCYLAHFKGPLSKARCLRLSRARWQIEQYFQRAKDDLGLDHYEGRSWRGFHHHLVLSAVAYLFVCAMWLRSKKNFWPDVGTDSQSDPSVAGEILRLLPLLSAPI
jgi:SRSO17 transposase